MMNGRKPQALTDFIETHDPVSATNSLGRALMISPDTIVVHETLARACRRVRDRRRADAHGRVAAALSLHERA